MKNRERKREKTRRKWTNIENEFAIEYNIQINCQGEQRTKKNCNQSSFSENLATFFFGNVDI